MHSIVRVSCVSLVFFYRKRKRRILCCLSLSIFKNNSPRHSLEIFCFHQLNMMYLIKHRRFLLFCFIQLLVQSKNKMMLERLILINKISVHFPRGIIKPKAKHKCVIFIGMRHFTRTCRLTLYLRQLY